MVISSIKWNGSMTIEYSTMRENLVVTSQEKPAKEFFDALADLKTLLCKSLQVPAERLAVCGLKIKPKKDEVEYVVQGFMSVTHTHHLVKISGVPMVVKGVNWFLQHCPEENPDALTPEDRIIINRFILAGMRFIYGARDQGELEFEARSKTEDEENLEKIIAQAESEIPEYDNIVNYWIQKKNDEADQKKEKEPAEKKSLNLLGEEDDFIDMGEEEDD